MSGDEYRETWFKGTPSRIELSLRPPWLSRARLAGPSGPLWMPDIFLRDHAFPVKQVWMDAKKAQGKPQIKKQTSDP